MFRLTRTEVEVSPYVVRAFVKLRELLISNRELAQKLDQLEARLEKKLTPMMRRSPQSSPRSAS